MQYATDNTTENYFSEVTELKTTFEGTDLFPHEVVIDYLDKDNPIVMASKDASLRKLDRLVKLIGFMRDCVSNEPSLPTFIANVSRTKDKLDLELRVCHRHYGKGSANIGVYITDDSSTIPEPSDNPMLFLWPPSITLPRSLYHDLDQIDDDIKKQCCFFRTRISDTHTVVVVTAPCDVKISK